jgi:chromate transporter
VDDTLLHLAWLMARLSLVTFGSIASVLGEMQREMVGRGWVTDAQFLEAYSLSQVAPGPAGTLVVVPLGYLTAGLPGAIVATLAYYTPTALLAFGLLSAWKRLRESPWPQALRRAVTPVAIGLLAGSLYSLGQATVREWGVLLLAAAAGLLLTHTRVPVPLVVLGCAVAGILWLQP